MEHEVADVEPLITHFCPLGLYYMQYRQMAYLVLCQCKTL